MALKSGMRLLEVYGTSFEMGRQHALAYPAEILELAEDRLQLSSNKYWTGETLSRQEVLALGRACLPEHETYAPDLMEELSGMSDVTGLSLSELVILNGFTDFIDLVHNHARATMNIQAVATVEQNREPQESTITVPAPPALDDCTAFIVSSDAAADGRGFLGQTWDMHETATPYVILLRGRPAQGPNFLTLTIVGCIGMIGMNGAGIAIGINNLVANDGQVGVTWPFVVRKVLAQDNLEAALACITQARLAGGHNFMLLDATGRGYNVEAMATHYRVEQVTMGTQVHTNHCLTPQNVDLERLRLRRSKASSETRLERGQELLGQRPLTLADLIALTRDHGATNGICVHPEDPFFVESCGATIMRPASREMWAVWGHPCQNEFERFVV